MGYEERETPKTTNNKTSKKKKKIQYVATFFHP